MGADWEIYGKKAYQGLKDNGIVATISFEREDDDYNILTGKNTTTSHEYTTHAILKNYEADSAGIVNPEDVEITFHSGSTPDTIPDLLDEKDIKITVSDKIYTVINVKAVRPAGVTMIYKARAKEYGATS